MGDEVIVTEVPSSLKRLARLVVRGFYSLEDALIIDMLVRNPCMKEDDICELLKFERKMLRSRIAQLRADKFIQVRLKMETGIDGKAQKVNYYFINYKTFVNVVKYKLDLMRKRMETEERDATSRASFKCTECFKTFTDLEADQLFDFSTGEFRCTFCKEIVVEDESALPKKDSRLMLAKFNEQLEPLFILLKEVEGIKLAPEILEPEPTDLSAIKGIDKKLNIRGSETWSGDATRGGGFAVEDQKVDVTIGDEVATTEIAPKIRPVWMVESTVITNDNQSITPTNDLETVVQTAAQTNQQNGTTKSNEDIMSVLLAHETKGSQNKTNNAIRSLQRLTNDADSDSNSDDNDLRRSNVLSTNIESNEIETFDDSEDDDNSPLVQVGTKSYHLNEINDKIIAEMTPQDKEVYIQIYQDYYSHMYE